MHKEQSTTTTVSEATPELVAAVDEVFEQSPTSESSRGSAEIDASFASHSFIKNLQEAPVFANQNTDDVFLKRVGGSVLKPVMLSGEQKNEEESSGVAAKTTTESLVSRSKERRTAASIKTRRSLGARALDAVRGFGKKTREINHNVTATVISKWPTSHSKEELLELNHAQKEKYADKATDGFFTRRLNSFRRNKYEAVLWSPVATIGSVALAAIAWRATGIADASLMGLGNKYNGSLPYEIMPQVENMANSRPIEIVMGGHGQGDPHQSGYTDALISNGLVDPENEIRGVRWTAQMAPVSGDRMSMVESDIEGAARLRETIDSAEGQPVRITVHSQGAEAGLRGLNQIAAENGGRLPDNMEVVIVGGPVGERSMINNNIIGSTNPILKSLGFEIDQPLPKGNITVITHINDVFGNSAGQSAGFTGLMAMSPGHTVEGVELYRYEKDGIKYIVKGSPSGMNHPLSQLLESQGHAVHPDVDRLFNAAIPRTELGEETQYTDVNEFGAVLGDVIDTHTGNNGYASRAVAGVMSEGRDSQFQDMSNIQRVPDKLARGDIAGAYEDTTRAVDAGMEFVEQPNRAVDAANDGIAHAVGDPNFRPIPETEVIRDIVDQVLPGAGAFVPTAENMKPIADAAAPLRGNAPVHNNVGVPVAPVVPAAPAAPVIDPNVQQLINQGTQFVNGFLGAR